MATEEDIQLIWLRSFLAVHRTGSFTAAAHEMHRVQSRISAQVGQLERVLGVQLFVRTRTQTILTEAGREFLPHAQEAVRQVQQGAAAAADREGPARGTVTVFSWPGASAFVLAPLIRQFRERHPEVSIVLTEHGQAVDLIHDGRVDIAIGSGETPTSRRLNSQPYFIEPVMGVVRYDDPLAAREALTVEDLSHRTLVMTGDPHLEKVPCRRYLNNGGVTDWSEYVVAHPTTVSAITAAGVGIGLLPAMACQLLGGDSELRVLPVDHPAFQRMVTILTDSGRRYPRVSRKFLHTMMTAPLPVPLRRATSEGARRQGSERTIGQSG